MRSILKVSAALSATATLLMVAGCGGTAKPDADHKATASKEPAAQRKSYNPPQKFAAKGVPLPEAAGRGSVTLGGTVNKPLPLVLHGPRAYIAAADSLQVLDTGTGKTTATVRPRHHAIADQDAETSAPVLTPDRRQALVPFVVNFPGKGTTPSRTGIELDAVNSTTGKTTWTLTLDDLPSWAAQPGTQARVIAATKDTAVVTVTNGEMGATYGIDLASHKARWHDPKVAAAAVIGDTAVALTSKDTVRQQVIGLDINNDGKRRWTKLDAYELTVRPAGPHLAAITGIDYDTGHTIATLLAPDGNKAADLTGDPSGMTCHYDDASITVCQSDGPRTIALDAKSGKQLWSLPDKGANRLAPTVTTAWHGLVYGTTSNGSIALDAKTGADRSAAPGVSPFTVNEYTGVALDPGDQHTLIAHPSVG